MTFTAADALLVELAGPAIRETAAYAAARERFDTPTDVTCVTPDNGGGGGCESEPVDTMIEDCNCAE